MNTKSPITKTTGPNTLAGRLRSAGAARLLSWLILLELPTVGQGQTYTNSYGIWYYMTNADGLTLTITGYSGPGGGFVLVPDSINSLAVSSFGDSVFPVIIYNPLSYSPAQLEIADGVTSIGEWAFWGWWELSYVSIGNSVTNVGEWAFHDCPSLSTITVATGNSFYSSVGGVLFDKSTNTLVQCPGAEAGSYTIPNCVTNIGEYAFEYCDSLTNITIGTNVTSIGESAFWLCYSLSAITVEPGNSSYSSVDGVLFDKSTNTLVQCPGAEAGSYTIPSSVASIGESAFFDCSLLTSVTIPNSVTNIGDEAFFDCSGLTSVTIPNNITSIGNSVFYGCSRLASVTIPSSVASIGDGAFGSCYWLTSVTIPNSVTNIGDEAFGWCNGLTNVFFAGNAPASANDIFDDDTKVTVYAVLGTAGWSSTFDGMPVVMVPGILWQPQSQTAEIGSTVDFTPGVPGIPAVTCLWFFDGTNLICCGTNGCLELTNVDASRDGAYTLVVTNAFEAVTSAPAMLEVIPAVPCRPVPVVQVTGETGSLLNVDYVNSLKPAPSWTTLGSVSLTSTSQFYFDMSMPLAPERFYRAWQSGAPGVVPSLNLPGLVPAVTLTGIVGNSVELDYINQFGPTNAWVTLGTIPLTNTSQLYFDLSALRQPPRLYRIVPVP